MKPAFARCARGELVQRHRDERRVADDVAEARAGDASGTVHVEAADLGVLAQRLERVRLADALQLLCVLFRVAVRSGVVRWVRDEREHVVAVRLDRCQLLLGLLELGLDVPERLELLGARLALELRARAEVVHLRNERSPALVGREQGIEVLGRSLALECGAPALGIAAGSLEVDHDRSLEAAGTTLWLRATRRAQLPAVSETYAATSAICCSVSVPSKGGIAPCPFVTRSTVSSRLGWASSRFGPIVPLVPASASV